MPSAALVPWSELTARVLVLPRLAPPAYALLLRSSHAFLDTFPVGGGITVIDALHAALPVVTLPRHQRSMHFARALLVEAGLGELVATSVRRFVALAVAVAGGRPEVRSGTMAACCRALSALPHYDSARPPRRSQLASAVRQRLMDQLAPTAGAAAASRDRDVVNAWASLLRASRT